MAYLALSLIQPWAHLILHGVELDDGSVLRKDVENRTWAPPRGFTFPRRILLHASSKVDRGEYDDARRMTEWIAGLHGRRLRFFPAFKNVERGGFVGAVTVTGAQWMSGRLNGYDPDEADPEEILAAGAWRVPDRWGYALSQPRPSPFLVWSGAPGFFEVEPVAVRALHALVQAGGQQEAQLMLGVRT